MPFSVVEGQPRAINALTAALSRGQVHHAYLFAGPDGVGKELAARALAQALVCDEKPNEGCGVCVSCTRSEHGNHPDVYFLLSEDAQVARKLAGRSDFGHVPSKDIRVEQIRKLQEALVRRPLEAKWKVVLVLGAEALNPAAQNAFLKTLEEPPRDTVLVLVTHAPQLLLPTLRSRMGWVGFGPLPEGWLVERLIQTKGLTRELAQITARRAQGSIGAALAMDSEALEAQTALVNDFEALHPDDVRPLLRFAETYGSSRQIAEDTLRALLAWNADVAQLQSGRSPALGGLAELGQSVAERQSPIHIQLRQKVMRKALEQLTERNAGGRLQLEGMVLELWA